MSTRELKLALYRDLEVVADPHRELRSAERGAATEGRESQIFPILVEERLPRVVEVDGKTERKCLEPEAVRRTCIDQSQPIDDGGRPVDRRLLERIVEGVPDDRYVEL